MYIIRLWPAEGHRHGAAIANTDTLLAYALILCQQKIPFMVYHFDMVCKPSTFGWPHSERELSYWITDANSQQDNQESALAQ